MNPAGTQSPEAKAMDRASLSLHLFLLNDLLRQPCRGKRHRLYTCQKPARLTPSPGPPACPPTTAAHVSALMLRAPSARQASQGSLDFLNALGLSLHLLQPGPSSSFSREGGKAASSAVPGAFATWQSKSRPMPVAATSPFLCFSSLCSSPSADLRRRRTGTLTSEGGGRGPCAPLAFTKEAGLLLTESTS